MEWAGILDMNWYVARNGYVHVALCNQIYENHLGRGRGMNMAMQCGYLGDGSSDGEMQAVQPFQHQVGYVVLHTHNALYWNYVQ